jgi:hypothetical protein
MEGAERLSGTGQTFGLQTERKVAKLLPTTTFANLSTNFMDMRFFIRLGSRMMSNIGARNIYLFISLLKKRTNRLCE